MLSPLLWDASSLAKYFVAERGSETVVALVENLSGRSMILTTPGYGETYAILRRRMNAGHLSKFDYDVARTALRNEVFVSSAFEIIAIEHLVVPSLPLIDRHNLNSTDAAILGAYLEYQHSLLSTEPRCILVASDHRLLRAEKTKDFSHSIRSPSRQATSWRFSELTSSALARKRRTAHACGGPGVVILL